MPANTEPNLASITLETTQSACLRAMGMLASGRAWLVFLISLAILVQAGLFATANWADVLQVRTPAATAFPGAVPAGENPQAAAARPDEESAATQPAPNALQNFWPPQKWESIMKLALPIAGFVGLASAIILIVLTMIGIQVNLIGRLPALAAMISAFYWSIITVALLFPWGSLINEPFGQVGDRIPWLFFTYKEVAAAAANTEASGIQALVWLRFIVWPLVSLLAAWVAGARFGKAYWQVVGLAEMPGHTRDEQA